MILVSKNYLSAINKEINVIINLVIYYYKIIIYLYNYVITFIKYIQLLSNILFLF